MTGVYLVTGADGAGAWAYAGKGGMARGEVSRRRELGTEVSPLAAGLTHQAAYAAEAAVIEALVRCGVRLKNRLAGHGARSRTLASCLATTHPADDARVSLDEIGTAVIVAVDGRHGLSLDRRGRASLARSAAGYWRVAPDVVHGLRALARGAQPARLVAVASGTGVIAGTWRICAVRHAKTRRALRIFGLAPDAGQPDFVGRRLADAMRAQQGLRYVAAGRTGRQALLHAVEAADS